jgi:hypothetical protein
MYYPTKETREKMSLAAKNRKPNFLGRHHSEETKAKLRAARYKQGNPAKGRKMSEEQKQFMRELYKGKTWGDPEKKKGHIPWNKGLRGIRKIQPEGYNLLHKWLVYNFGNACMCENINCPKKSKTYQWAKLKDKEYQRNRENFIELCASCHQLYDRNKLDIIL